MIESGYYPPGAEHDPNAPYNQPDYDWAYEKAADIIRDEMNADNETFVEWLEDEEYLPAMNNKICEKTFLSIVDILANDDQVFEAYYEHRKEDVATGIIEESSEGYDYDLRDEIRDSYLD